MMNVGNTSSRTPPRWLPAAFALSLLPFMVWTSGDYGVTWDELPRQLYGEEIWQYYEGRRPLDLFRANRSGAHLYGGLFEVGAIALQRTLDLDPYRIRHGWTAVVGWLGIVACGALAARLAGRAAGLLAMVLLALTPPYWGHAMNNPKDLPFATTATLALVAMSAVPPTHPLLTWQRTVGLGVAIGAALAIRPGGLLLLGYAAVVLMRQGWRARPWTTGQCAQTSARFAIVVAIATTVPLPFWPWLQHAPYLGLIEAVQGVSHFQWRGTTIFMGADAHAMRLPWTYIPVWLLVSMPLVVLVGAFLAIGLSIARRVRQAGVLGLTGAVVFPIAYVIVKQSTLYDGLRHLLFVVPPLVALAAIGWTAALTGSRRPVAAGAMVALLAGLAEPAVFSWRNHPNQVVYFNQVAGGPRGAVGRFELDYWGNCLYQAQQAVAGIARKANMPIVVSGHRWRLMGANAGRLPQLVVRRPELAAHHLEIVLHRGSRAQVLALLDRGDVITRIQTADGATLCSVVPGPAFAELAARLGW
jgi:hypothetical protein